MFLFYWIVRFFCENKIIIKFADLCFYDKYFFVNCYTFSHVRKHITIISHFILI